MQLLAQAEIITAFRDVCVHTNFVIHSARWHVLLSKAFCLWDPDDVVDKLLSVEVLCRFYHFTTHACIQTDCSNKVIMHGSIASFDHTDVHIRMTIRRNMCTSPRTSKDIKTNPKSTILRPQKGNVSSCTGWWQMQKKLNPYLVAKTNLVYHIGV